MSHTLHGAEQLEKSAVQVLTIMLKEAEQQEARCLIEINRQTELVKRYALRGDRRRDIRHARKLAEARQKHNSASMFVTDVKEQIRRAQSLDSAGSSAGETGNASSSAG